MQKQKIKNLTKDCGNFKTLKESECRTSSGKVLYLQKICNAHLQKDKKKYKNQWIAKLSTKDEVVIANLIYKILGFEKIAKARLLKNSIDPRNLISKVIVGKTLKEHFGNEKLTKENFMSFTEKQQKQYFNAQILREMLKDQDGKNDNFIIEDKTGNIIPIDFGCAVGGWPYNYNDTSNALNIIRQAIEEGEFNKWKIEILKKLYVGFYVQDQEYTNHMQQECQSLGIGNSRKLEISISFTCYLTNNQNCYSV